MTEMNVMMSQVDQIDQKTQIRDQNIFLLGKNVILGRKEFGLKMIVTLSFLSRN